MAEVPNIRFKGYTDAWEQRKFKDIFEYISNNTLSRAELNYESGDVRNVHYGDVLISLGEYMDVQTTTLPFITDKEKSSKAENALLADGDIVIADTAEDETVGKCTEIGNVIGSKVVAGLHTMACKPKLRFGRGYLGFYMNSNAYHDQLRPLMQGIKVTSVAKSAIEDTVLYYPQDVVEQEKIGNFFMSLDNAITLHQRKLDELSQFKKYMLQKMFPKNGENIPEIRFSGFTDAWEQRKFGDFYKKVTEKNDLSFGADKIISVANMYYKEDVGKSDDDYMKTYNVMRLGDIAFEGNRSKNFAHGRFVENTIGDGIVSHVFDVFRPTMEYDLFFWKYLINNESVMGKILTRSTKASTMMTNLVADDFLKETVSVPQIEEQRKIGAFLKQLDDALTLHQRKLDELKSFKKYMLQNMFPQEG